VSRSTVRHAIADYLTAGAITGVGTIFASPPKLSRTSDALVGAAPGAVSGAVVYIEITESFEIRVGLGGTGAGKKSVHHTVQCYVFFHSVQRRAEDAMDDHDDIIEGLLVRIRADRTHGTAGSEFPILQAGEGDPGIAVQTSLPKDAGGGAIDIWTSIKFDAEEFITA